MHRAATPHGAAPGRDLLPTNKRQRRGRRWRAGMRSSGAIAAILGILTLWSTCQAADFTCPAGDVACLINAINAANMNGKKNTITLAAGTYTLTEVDDITDGPNGLPAITSALIITGMGAVATTIERLGPRFRLVHVAATGSLTLQEVTVQGFSLPLVPTAAGGGIRNDGTLTIINSALNRNEANFGGGIFNEGSVTITNSSLSRNRGFSNGQGGGIYNSAGGTVVLSESTLSFNGAGHGAAAVLNAGTATIVDSTIVSHQGGDALASNAPIVNGGTLTIMNSTLSGNHGTQNAAGAIDNLGTLTITDSSLSGNSGGAAGAIHNFDFGTLTISNSTLSGNISTLRRLHAGAITNDGTLTITNSTLADNVACVGGILSAPDTSVVEVQNTILARNVVRALSCPNGVTGAPDCFGLVNSLDNNLIGDPTGCTITLLPHDLTGDPGLDTFTDDGTSGNGHYPLLPTSQAIDAGEKRVCPKRDQIGQKRHRPSCDIGAIEFPDRP